ncbi:hypothetical protein HDU84_008614 [Entophlyctis sp. JEL0112]|nr:hypothetical protein HDU84_008614 [Entophlyctis sp. JEL0112]
MQPRRSDYFAVQWACWMKRAVAVPLCTSHPPAELAHVVSNSTPSLVLHAPEFSKSIEAVKLDDRVLALSTESPQYHTYDNTNHHEVSNVDFEWDDANPLDKSSGALIIYTSGTTGKPKGVLTTFGNIEAQVATLHAAWRWTSRDRIPLVLPLHHVHGVINVATCALAAGATLELTPDPLRPADTWLKLFMRPQRDLTLFMAVPTVYARLLEYYDAQDSAMQSAMADSLHQFRLMVCGSAALPHSVFQKWEKISGTRLLERYGMTEIGMALGNPYDGDREAGKVGVPFPGVEVKIVDEIGQDLTGIEGASGELLVRGPQVFKEYWNYSGATKQAFDSECWFKTGDIATVTPPNGYFQILGRASVDIIKSGGFKLSALTIERAILEVPGVKDVAVVGVPDDMWGEKVGAMVVVGSDFEHLEDSEKAASLKVALKSRLAKYEVPSIWRFVTAIPRNAMLKRAKHTLPSGESTSSPEITSGPVVSEKRSRFMAHISKVKTSDDVTSVVDTIRQSRVVRGSTHNIVAYRLASGKEAKDDDGETGAGDRILDLLARMKIVDVVVIVTRWYGGVPLGPSRFRIITNTVKSLINASNFK